VVAGINTARRAADLVLLARRYRSVLGERGQVWKVVFPIQECNIPDLAPFSFRKSQRSPNRISLHGPRERFKLQFDKQLRPRHIVEPLEADDMACPVLHEDDLVA